MSERETTGPSGNVYVIESADTSLSKLTELARQAYDQKRTKDCLDFTRAILLMDPENAEAQLMRSSIRSEIRQDLEKVSAMLRQARVRQENPEMFSQSMVRNEAEESVEAQEAETISAQTDHAAPSTPAPTEELVVTGAVMEKTFDAPVRRANRRWLKPACVIVFGGLIVAGLPRLIGKSNLGGVSPSLRTSNGAAPLVAPSTGIIAEAAPKTARPEKTEADWWLPEPAPAPAVAIAANASAAAGSSSDVQPASLKIAPAPQPALNRDKPAGLVAPGTLAISSPTSVEIYLDDTYLGSAPVSLEMPAGTHTIEYRHGSLRKTVTHVVNSNETTRAMINFDVTIQVNSKPWAEVFVDGVDRKSLGQTPLSGIRVPIGGVLVFENPGFRPKRYRVTGNETGIQMVFP